MSAAGYHPRVSARSSQAADAAATRRLRARDIDRVGARARLDAAYEEGQLGAEEYHDRSERAGAARTLGDLDRLVGDLQPTTVPVDVAAPVIPPVQRSGGYPPRTRARDDDRAAACAILDSALGDGQLTEADHRTLIELAGAAQTLGALSDLTDDLQRSADARADARPPTSTRRLWLPIVVAAASIAAAVGAFGWAHSPDGPPAPLPTVALGIVEPKVFATPNYTTAEGITHFRQAYAAKFGGTVVDEVTLFDEHVAVTRAPQPNRVVKYTYRGGFEQQGEVTSRQTSTATVDLAAIDIGALARLIADAPGLLRVDKGAVSHIGYDADRTTGPTLNVYVTNSFNENGYMTATPAGVILRTYPFKG